MRRKGVIGLGIFVIGLLIAGAALWRIYSQQGKMVTPSDLKEKYEQGNERINLEKTRYGVSKTQKFCFDFTCNLVETPMEEWENLITVHTDRACLDESKIYAGFYLEETKEGSRVTIFPNEQVLKTESDKQTDNWGSAPVYYLAIRYDRETETVQKLDKPSVIPFTLKSDCQVPNLSASVDEYGIFRLTWSPVEGAEEYRIYNYTTKKTKTGERNEATEGAAHGYHNGYFSYEGSTKNTEFESFSGEGKNEVSISSYKDGQTIVWGENYYVRGDYYVTAVVDGRESVLSNAVTTHGRKLPYCPVEEKDILYNRYKTIQQLPASVPVKNIDGSVQNRKVLYTFQKIDGLLGEVQCQYRYRLEGTKLSGYVVMKGKRGESYPEKIGTPSPAGEKIPTDEADRIPQVTSQPEEPGEEESVPALNPEYYIQADSAAGEWLALNLIAGKEKIYIGDFPELTEPDGLREIFYSVYYQNPYVFGIESFDCDYQSLMLEIRYLYSQREREQMCQEMTNSAKAILAKENISSLDREERVEKIYQWFSENCVYDREAFAACQKSGYRKNGGEKYEYAHNAYGALVLGKGMCQAYADAFLLLCHLAEVEAVAVSGYMNQSLPHVWNKVKLEDKWYHVDVTNSETNTGVPYYLYLAGQRCAASLQYIPDERAEGGTGKEIYPAPDETKEYYTVHGLALKTAEKYLPIVENSLKKGEAFPVVRREGAIKEEELVYNIEQAFRRTGKSAELKKHTWQTVGKYFLLK